MFRSYVKLPEGISFPTFGGVQKAVSPREIKKHKAPPWKCRTWYTSNSELSDVKLICVFWGIII